MVVKSVHQSSEVCIRGTEGSEGTRSEEGQHVVINADINDTIS